jgi:hypothetical protein
MKSNNFIRLSAVVALFLTASVTNAQDSVVKEPTVKLSYYSVNNTIPYLLVKTQFKEGKKYTPAANISVQVNMDGDSTEVNLLGKFTTNENGEAKLILPVSSQSLWNSASQHHFKATASGKNFESTETELSITKSKISIDTSSDSETKSVTATVSEFKDGGWVPAKDVELKIGISRLNSLLPVGDEETYTTDSSGTVTAEFKKDSMPGDIKGNISLIVKADDNESFGNISAEKIVPWGKYYKYENNFNKRSLWAAQFRSPIWLLLMAYSIIAGVWGVLIYLVFQIIKIRKLRKITA